MTEYLPARPGWAHRSEIASWRLRRQNFPSRSYREETRFFVSYRARIGGDPPTPSFPYFNIEVFVTRCRGLPETCVTVSEQLSGCLITYQKFELDIHFFPNVPPMIQGVFFRAINPIFPCGAITTPYFHCLILCWYRPSTHTGVFMSESPVHAQDDYSCKASGAIYAPTNARSR